MTIESSISWLDFSESERRKMIEIVSLFKERDTRDELGLATIRDSLADLLFPGTGTLQTRARYFLFVPWFYRYYEERQEGSAKIGEKLRQREINLIDVLRNTGETDGVIGQRSGASLNRFPSSIYWMGLQRWGICYFPGTQDQYHRSLDRWYASLRLRSSVDELSPWESVHNNWDPALPERPKNFPYEADLNLLPEESQYLKERLQMKCTDSLLTYLVENASPVDETVRSVWLHPIALQFPAPLQNWVTHARNFSETLHGAALLYNWMLALVVKREEWIEYYDQELKTWRSMLMVRKVALKSWNRAEFWNLVCRPGVNVRPGTRRFIDEWLDLLLGDGHIANPEKDKSMRNLVEVREQRLKGSLSRFTNTRQRELWSGSSFAGQIDYRWRVTRRISNDILIGLGGGSEAQNAHTG